MSLKKRHNFRSFTRKLTGLTIKKKKMNHTVWYPDSEKDEGSDDVVRVNGMDALRLPLSVETTKGEIVSLCRRLSSEKEEARRRLSNEAFRFCVENPVRDDSSEEEVETLSGKILLFHACRFVISGSGFPCVS